MSGASSGADNFDAPVAGSTIFGCGVLSCTAGIGFLRPLGIGASNIESSPGVTVVDDHGLSGTSRVIEVLRLPRAVDKSPAVFAGEVGSSSFSSSSLRTSLLGDDDDVSAPSAVVRLASATPMLRFMDPSFPIAVTQPLITSLPSKA